MGKYRQNILVVESDQECHSNLDAWLGDAGYYVKTVDSAYDALEVLQLHPFDALLLSEYLTRMTGLSFLKKIKASAQFRSLPVILMSKAPEPSNLQRFRVLGVNDCLIKPLSRNILLAKLDNVLGNGLKLLEVPFSQTDSVGYSEVVFQSRVVSIGEMGMTIASKIPLEQNSVHRLRAKVFGSIGVNSPNLRVTKCTLFDEGYKVSMSYEGMSQTDHESIKLWVAEHSYTDVTQ